MSLGDIIYETTDPQGHRLRVERIAEGRLLRFYVGSNSRCVVLDGEQLDELEYCVFQGRS